MSDATLDLAAAGHGAFTAAGEGARVSDFLQLLKPRVMSLVVFSGFAGMMVAPGHLHPLIAAVAVLCIAVGAGASGAINMWYDRDIDAIMSRTAKRPIPAGRIEPAEALAFGVVLAIASVGLMALAVNLAGRGPSGADDPLLRLRLHDLAEAPHAAEHRHRRRGRRLSADDRLGRGHRPCRPGTRRSVPADLHVDAAAFLGAGAVPRRRLRQGRRADAAGGGRRARDQAPDADLYAAAVPAGAGPLGAWALPASSMAPWLPCWARSSSLRRSRVCRDATDRSAKRMFAYSILYLFLLFALLIVDRAPGLTGRLAGGLA